MNGRRRSRRRGLSAWLSRPVYLLALALTLGLIVVVAPPAVFMSVKDAAAAALPWVFVVASVVVAGAGAWLVGRRAVPAVADAVGRWVQAARLRRRDLADVDAMDGPSFEHFVAGLLARRGFHVEHTGGSGDLGVDLIVRQGYTSWAVQVKRYDGPVSRRAVSDAVAGKAHYGCNDAMVVTNSTFTEGARRLARSNGCELVDRYTLARWMRETQT